MVEIIEILTVDITVGLRQDYDQPEETNASDREGVRGHATHG